MIWTFIELLIALNIGIGLGMFLNAVFRANPFSEHTETHRY